jgi:hypothetical protein
VTLPLEAPLPHPRLAIFVSPALSEQAVEQPAFEVKFLLSENEARDVERLLQPRMLLDPYADPALGNAYRITSVYYDTAAFDVYHRGDGFRSRKYRLRRYGLSPTVFLERKSKRDQQVKKLRTAIPLDGLASLQKTNGEEWPGAWFVRQVTSRNLQPVCRVSYARVAYAAASPDGPVRLTFDRAAQGMSATGPVPDTVVGGSPLLDGEVIVEFKFIGGMPVLFKEVIERLKLTPRSGSKYRRCVDAVGLIATEKRGHV